MGEVQAFQERNYMDQKWIDFLDQEKTRPYYSKLKNYLAEQDWSKIYPAKENIFRVYEDVPFDEVKIVILGQGPYHGPNQAIGRAFAVNKDCKEPPSLRNIFKEIDNEYGHHKADRTLNSWAQQGIFLLNNSLTIREGEPNSHSKIGWDLLVDHTISKLNRDRNNVVFMLWGNFAKKKSYLINNPSHLVLKAAHPSPLSASRGFFGCNHFIQANQFLKDRYNQEIIW